MISGHENLQIDRSRSSSQESEDGEKMVLDCTSSAPPSREFSPAKTNSNRSSQALLWVSSLLKETERVAPGEAIEEKEIAHKAKEQRERTATEAAELLEKLKKKLKREKDEIGQSKIWIERYAERYDKGKSQQDRIWMEEYIVHLEKETARANFLKQNIKQIKQQIKQINTDHEVSLEIAPEDRDYSVLLNLAVEEERDESQKIELEAVPELETAEPGRETTDAAEMEFQSDIVEAVLLDGCLSLAPESSESKEAELEIKRELTEEKFKAAKGYGVLLQWQAEQEVAEEAKRAEDERLYATVFALWPKFKAGTPITAVDDAVLDIIVPILQLKRIAGTATKEERGVLSLTLRNREKCKGCDTKKEEKEKADAEERKVQDERERCFSVGVIAAFMAPLFLLAATYSPVILIASTVFLLMVSATICLGNQSVSLHASFPPPFFCPKREREQGLQYAVDYCFDPRAKDFEPLLPMWRCHA